MTTRTTVHAIRTAKGGGQKLTMLTAYDAPMARLLDESGIDILLVGDSLGMVVLGYDSTVPVTMAEMLHHARAVCRGRQRALVVGDMPFGSYQAGETAAVENGIRFLKEGGCDAVKLEGGLEVADTVRALVRAGIAVMGHIGLTPQTAGQLGGFKVQGRDLDSARRLLAEARALDRAGVFALVLECVPDSLARLITAAVSMPTFGIGAGPGCDGQVLVTQDMVGLFERFTPRFVKQYCRLAPLMREALADFRREVAEGCFPAPQQCFTATDDFTSLLEESGAAPEEETGP